MNPDGPRLKIAGKQFASNIVVEAEGVPGPLKMIKIEKTKIAPIHYQL